MPRPRGPVPKPDAQRRRRNKPESYGAATPTAPNPASAAPELNIDDPHPLIVDMWDALAGGSIEGTFYTPAAWCRLRIELSRASKLMHDDKPNANAWTLVQKAFDAFLISPADMRRAGIEMGPAIADEDEEAAELAVLATVTELHA